MSIGRVEITVSGRVQGVGFRWHTQRVASSLRLTGWVKNLPDGRVHLVCEGTEGDFRHILAEISDRMQAFIRDTQED